MQRWCSLLCLLGILCFSTAPSRSQSSPTFGDFDPRTIADINLDDYPILPGFTEHAAELYAEAVADGRNPAMFSKVGDSMTFSSSFLVGFGTDEYDLGEYTDLQATVDYLNAGEINPFSRENYATALGFSTAAALDPFWANAEICETNESPLACEFRVSKSVWALTMFGTNDVMNFDETTFDYFYRTVIEVTLEAGVIPVLYTFPERPEEPEKSLQFNKVIVRMALDYDLPLINLAKALEGLEHRGVDPADTLHLTHPEAVAAVTTFNETTLKSGYTVRNLVTLQALDVLLRESGSLPEGES